MIDAMSLYILVGAALFAASVFTSLISFRVGAPLLLVFLAIGLLAGEDGPGGIVYNDMPSAYLLGSLALAVILFDSGFQTRADSIRAAGPPAAVLATLGVLITAALFGAAAHLALDLTLIEGFLLGAVVGSTDAAAMFFLLRVGGITVRERVRATLEIEAGGNDPMAVFLVVVVIEAIVHGAGVEALSLDLAIGFITEMGVGLAAGLAGGWLIVQAVNRIEFEAGLYPVVVMSLALCLYGATDALEGSGFLSVYVAGAVAGNAQLRAAGQLRRFQNAMTWICQIGMFLLLGLLATPSEFVAIGPQAAALAAFLIFVARPVAVWLCLLPFGFTRHETAFVSYVGLRGAVSILLAIFPFLSGLPSAELIFNTAFVIVLVSLVVQGWAIRPLARLFDLIVPPTIGPVDRIELELPGRGQHELVAYRIAPDCPVARGVRIPRWARPSLVVRDGRSMPAHAAGRPAPGDLVLAFVAPDRIRLLDRLFASPAELHAEDLDFWGAFGLPSHAPMSGVARAYGLRLQPGHAERTVGEVLGAEFGGAVEVGDRIRYDSVELIVRRVEEHGVAEVGLSVEPARQLPIFPTRRDIVWFLRRLRAYLSQRRAPPAAPAADTPAPAAALAAAALVEESLAAESPVVRDADPARLSDPGQAAE